MVASDRKGRRRTLSQNSMVILGASWLSGATKVTGFIISSISSVVFTNTSAMMVTVVKEGLGHVTSKA